MMRGVCERARAGGDTMSAPISNHTSAPRGRRLFVMHLTPPACDGSLPSPFPFIYRRRPPSSLRIELCLGHEAISNGVLARCDVSTSREQRMGGGFGRKHTAGGEIHFDDSCHLPIRVGRLPLACDVFTTSPS